MVENTDQYPDTITITWKDEPVKDPLTGKYIKETPRTFESACRIEANNASRKIEGVDGALIDYGYDVFLPQTDVIIPAFVADYVTSGPSFGVIHGKVKRMRNQKFNSRLWV